MKTRIHAIAGAIGFLTVLTFLTSTILSELFGSHETVAAVKRAILWGLFILIPAMAIVGGSGFSLAGGRTDAPVPAKKKRMPVIGGIGLLVLVPSAFLLSRWATAGQFGTTFYLLQGVEIAGGFVNLTLMGLNMRDGLALTGRTKPSGTVTLVSSETIASGTMAFHMKRPKGFAHKAGQWVRLTLPDLTNVDSKGPTRVLSIVSAPHEADLTVATRISDSTFKQGLKSLKSGAALELAGPSGVFVLGDDTSRPAVFIAGGIGITPFMSMIRDVTHKGSDQKITLFYSNRDPEASAYLAELQELEAANPHFTLVATMTGDDVASSWSGETGFIDKDMLERHLSDIKAPLYYCVGSGGLVAAMKDMLGACGIAEKDIILEQFPGY